MRELEILMNANHIVEHIGKPSNEFTKDDIIKYIVDNNIKMLNFRYVAEDGKLKTLNFVISNKNYLNSIFATGERVDGSSLFSFLKTDSADLYVIPRFESAFINPFSEIPTLDLLCSFYTKDGKPLESSPEYILKKSYNLFKKDTGLDFKAMGELEYYIIGDNNEKYILNSQKGYHSSSPFSKFETFRKEAMLLIAQCGGNIKYGHSEVGNFTMDDKYYEQHEIEFNPVEVNKAIEQLIIAKWVLRSLSLKYNIQISFTPKITPKMAGSGLHIHMLLEKKGENIILDGLKLSKTTKKMIGGLLSVTKSLTAFGNTIPVSYLRLVPNQEAPTDIFWGYSNRAALIRIPLGWAKDTNMIKDANPQQVGDIPYIEGKQTIEYRVPDGSANLYLLLAGMLLAARKGILNKEYIKIAEDTYVDGKKLSNVESLPRSCYESAKELKKERIFYEEDGVFPKSLIDNIVTKLKSFDDKDLNKELKGKDMRINKMIAEYIHFN